jgi:hypothetical protein
VEVKSANAGSLKTPSFENGVMQLKIALRYRDDADTGALYVINPSTLRPADIFKVVLTDEAAEAIDETFRRIERHIELEVLPDRVCAKPSQARGYLCPLVAACFEGWEPPDIEEIDTPEAHTAVAELARIKAQETTLRRALDALETERKDQQQVVGDLVPVGDSIVGGFAVKRIHKTRGPSFSVKAYQAAGGSLEALAEYLRGGSEWDEYRITTGAGGTTDFGEDAPF